MKKSELRQIIKEEIKQLLSESIKIGSVTVYPDKKGIGSSLHYKFTEQEHNKLYKWLKKYSNGNPWFKTILQQLDNKQKYTDSLLVAYKGKAFTIYGASGDLRVGSGGGDTTAPKLLSTETFKDFISGLK